MGEEVRRSMDLIAARVGEQPRHFAYPYGGRQEVSKRVGDIVAAAGFRTAVTTRYGAVERKADLFHLPRIFFADGETLEGLCRKVRQAELKNKVKRFLRKTA